MGFTLIEMLVVMAIVILLTAIIIPSVSGALRSAQHTHSMNNLRQWGTATLLYMTESGGRMPSRGPEERPSWGEVMNARNAWYNVLPPYVGEQALMDIPAHERVNFLEGTSMHRDPAARFNTGELSERPLFSYTYNSQMNVSRTHGNHIPGRGDLRRDQLFISDYTTPSNTVLFFESRVRREDGHPSQTSANQMGRAYGHSRHVSFRYGGRVNILFLDGATRRFRSDEIFNGTQVINEPVIWEGLE